MFSYNLMWTLDAGIVRTAGKLSLSLSSPVCVWVCVALHMHACIDPLFDEICLVEECVWFGLSDGVCETLRCLWLRMSFILWETQTRVHFSNSRNSVRAFSVRPAVCVSAAVAQLDSTLKLWCETDTRTAGNALLQVSHAHTRAATGVTRSRISRFHNIFFHRWP